MLDLIFKEHNYTAKLTWSRRDRKKELHISIPVSREISSAECGIVPVICDFYTATRDIQTATRDIQTAIRDIQPAICEIAA